MKKHASIILLLLFLSFCLLIFSWPLFPKTALHGSLEKIVAAQQKQVADDKAADGIRWLTDAEAKDLLREAEIILTASIKANPGHRELLTRRSEVHFMLGEIDKVLQDLEVLISVTGGWPEILMFRCMILEAMGTFEDNFFTCYEEVCERYKKKEKPIPLDSLNWAFAELMAGRPEKAEMLLEESRKTPELMTNETWNLFLEPDGTFNRKNFLERLIPLQGREIKN